MDQTPSYRLDIDGLRGLAVLAVVVYHYGIEPFSGGFVGVDVFFVISGYLITRIVRKEVEQHTFTFRAFFFRRARRILPALTLVVGTTLAFSWFVLLPGDYRDLAWQATSAQLGFSNIYFWRNTGYFDQSSDLLPLLHTWSLGVEEQFYLFWPAVLLALCTVPVLGRPRPGIFVVILMALGFGVALYGMMVSVQASFYLLPARAWEMLVGAAIAFAPSMGSRRASEIASVSGLAAIGIAIFMFTNATPFPGLAAVLPCAGAALVIWPKESNSVSKVLSLKALVGIGLVSYSLYLWHWPVLVLFRHFANGEMPNAQEGLVLIGISFALAYFSWRFVERPFRRNSQFHWKRAKRPALVISALLLSAIGIAATDGAGARVAVNSNIGDRDRMWAWPCASRGPSALDEDGCYFGLDWHEARTRALVWGDSHAQALAPVLEATLGDDAAFFLHGGCAAIISHIFTAVHPIVPSTYDKCPDGHERVVDYLGQNGDINLVVLAGIWSAYPSRIRSARPIDFDNDADRFSAALRAVIEAIHSPGRRIVLVGDIPRFSYDPVSCFVSSIGLLRRECAYRPNAVERYRYESMDGSVNGIMSALAREYPDVFYVPAGENLCDTGTHCLTMVNGEFIYRDTDHLRRDLTQVTLNELGKRMGLEKAMLPVN
jgi:peptidoglycan/LPS O-acetylase OafA/YrhL